MTALLISIITSGWTTALFGAVSAAYPALLLLGRFFPNLKLYLMLAKVLVVVGAAGVAFTTGYRLADERSSNAMLRNELAFKTHQLEVQKRVSEYVEKDLIVKLDQKTAELEKIGAELEAAVAKKPERLVCRATADDVKWLLRIR